MRSTPVVPLSGPRYDDKLVLFHFSSLELAVVADRSIRLRGVAVHNLKRVDLYIPLGKLIVICGLSGSGKTSLALDTLYAEGQRRYIESFSAYDRQFLDKTGKAEPA